MISFLQNLLGKEPQFKVDENSYFAVLESIPVSVVITDPNLEDNPIVFCNYAFEQVTGYSRDECIGKNCRFLQGIDTDRKSVSLVRESVRNAQPVNVIVTNYKKYGQPFKNELIIVPVIVKGRLKYFVGIQNDIGRPTYIPNDEELEKIHGKKG